MNKTFITLSLALLLTACASGVKLNEVPVVDKKGSDISSSTSSTGLSEISQSDSSSSQQVQQPKSTVEPVNSLANDNTSDGTANNDNTSDGTANNDNTSDGTANLDKIPKVIYFDFDKYTIKPEFQSTIEAHAQFLKANSQAKVSLEGHTDEQGGREYNLALGQKRADAVRQSLSLLGVNTSQIETVSFGEEKPAAEGSDESAYSKNRRAEFFYK